jgi:hypothetical protein
MNKDKGDLDKFIKKYLLKSWWLNNYISSP